MTKLFSEMTTERLKTIYSHIENTRACSTNLLKSQMVLAGVNYEQLI